MAIRSDSYSSAAEVLALTRHLLDGEPTFNSETRPTLTEVEKFIDRSSGVLNSALWGAGFDPANVTANSTAKLSCDDWVTIRAANWVESTQRLAGFSDLPNEKPEDLQSMAQEAVDGWMLGFARMGITVSDPAHQGLQFTAMDDHDERSDPDSDTIEQPLFRRRMFENS